MGTSLTGNTIASSYLGLLKTTDNAIIGSSGKRLTDGDGTDSPLYLSTGGLGIGVTPNTSFSLTVENDTWVKDQLLIGGSNGVATSGSTLTLDGGSNTSVNLRFKTNNTGNGTGDGGQIGFDDSSGILFLKSYETSASNAGINITDDGGNTILFAKESSKNVGINTTSPSSKLTISGGDILLDNSNKLLWGNTSDVYIAGTTSADNIQLGVGGATQFTFAQTTGMRLHQYGSGNITGTVTQRLGVTSTGQVVEIPIGGGAVDGAGTANDVVMWSDANTITDAPIAISSNDATFAGDITVTGGNVTLGTDSISSSLNSLGDILSINVDSDADGAVSANLQFKISNSEKMRLNNTGLGIGTNSFTAPLTVAGNVDVIKDAGNSTLFHRIHNQGTATNDDAVLTWQTQSSRHFSMGIHRDSGELTISSNDASVADNEMVTMALNGDMNFASNGNSTRNFIFKNTDTTGTSVRTHLEATAGNRTTRLEAIHSDYNYVVGNSSRLYLQTNDASNTPLFLDGDNATFAGDVTLGDTSSENRTLSLQTNSEKDSVINFKEGSNLFGYSIGYFGVANDFIIKRHDNSASGTAVLTLNREDSNALFAGTITSSSGTLLLTNGSNTRGFATNGSGQLQISNAANSAGVLFLTDDSLTLGSVAGTGSHSLFAGNATFAGDVTISNGKFLKLVRNSGSLATDAIGITSGTDDVRFLTTGDFNFVNGSLTNLLTIKNNGSIGIGTTSPSSIVHIADATNPVLRVEDTTNSATVAMYATDSNLFMGALSNHSLAILTNDIPAITIDTSQNATFAGKILASNDAPAFAFSSDTETGMARTGTHQIAFKNNDVDSLTLASDLSATFAGKGIFNDSARVANNKYFEGTHSNGSTALRMIGIDNNGDMFMGGIDGNVANVTIRDGSGNNTMTITTSGNVGINETSPNDTLHVQGDVKIVSGVQKTPLFEVSSFIGGHTGDVAYIHCATPSSTGYNLLHVQGDSDDTPIEALVVRGDGNVGISTTAPTAKIQIENTSAGNATVGAFLVNSSTNTNTEVRLAFASHTNSDIATNRYSYISTINTSGSNGQDMIFATNATGAGGTEKLRISSTGLTTIKRTGITGFGKNDMTLQIGFEGNNGQHNLIGFGFNGGTGVPAYMGFTTTSGSSNTKGALVFGTRDVVTDSNPTERMRIKSDGSILINTTSNTQDGCLRIDFNDASSSPLNAGIQMTAGRTNSSNAMIFGNPNGTVGTIQTSASATAYNTSSDYRLKEDLKDFNALEIASKIKMYDFKWKADNTRSYGVMAHELQEVVPQAVSGDKDDKYMQQVDYSKLVPILLKSIQELEARVKELEKEI